jgi:UDP-N-acetylmuramyl pentapeptide phosphotransferase/UDP-N-acetylglucosamine-1-phosphate transferase
MATRGQGTHLVLHSNTAGVGTPYNSRVLPLLFAFGVSAILTLLVVRLQSVHAHRTGDHDFDKPQGFHVEPVPRIGGLAIVAGVAVGVVPVLWLQGQPALWLALVLLACALPAFLAGFVQDFTEALSPRGRLLATAVAATLAFFALNAAITRTDIPGLDWVVASVAGSLLVTVFAVAGIAHAVNIIDGFNGLASMCVVIMLAALAYVGYQVEDPLVALLALAGVGAVLGFFIWNFPAGLIFLGDGGAYFLGFYVAELLILLLVRNPEVSPLFPLLVCVYPAFETLFSVYRRYVLRGTPPSMPDGIHLHSLIYRRVMRWAVGNRSSSALTRRNSMTSPYLWLLCMLSAVPAMLAWDTTWVLALALLTFAITYLSLYWRIVRFRSPRWLRFPLPPSRGHVKRDNRP